MVSRASRALAVKPLTEKYEQSGENSYTAFERPTAALVAFEKLAGELRRWMQHIERNYSLYTTPDPGAVEEHRQRRSWDTRHDPDAAPSEPATAEPPHEARPGGGVRDAYEQRANGDGVWAAFDALNGLLDRAERCGGAPPPSLPHNPPGVPLDRGPGP
jgi:hypothetical protein